MYGKWLLLGVFVAAISKLLHARPQPFIGAMNNPYATVPNVPLPPPMLPSNYFLPPVPNVGPGMIPLPPPLPPPIPPIIPFPPLPPLPPLPPPRPLTPLPLLPPRVPQPPPQNSYLEKPAVKRFIAEVTAHTSRYSDPNESYGRILLLMRQYFTRMDPLHRLYDGTLILPSVSPLGRSELAANVRVTGLLFENDMALTLSQMSAVNSLKQPREKRKLISDPTLHWQSQSIAYRFGNSDDVWQNQIRQALRYWQQETCLRFVENQVARDYLFFTIGSGCYSSVGRLGGSQTVSIGYGCETLGIISHELGHALGFWHEQERPDRDNYVHINLQNVISGTEGNFEKRKPWQLIDLGVPYDLGSVMHYSANTFAKRFVEFTVDPLDIRYRSTVGNRVTPAFTDFKQINLLYCSDRCRTTNLRCEHGGYPDPNNCAICKCPDGLGGRTCIDLQYSSCGYEQQATNTWQTLTYSGASNCYWRIISPNGQIRFELTEAYYKCDPACEDYVEIKHKLDLQISGFRSCCLPAEGQVISEGNMVVIISRASRPSHFTLRYINAQTTMLQQAIPVPSTRLPPVPRESEVRQLPQWPATQVTATVRTYATRKPYTYATRKPYTYATREPYTYMVGPPSQSQTYGRSSLSYARP